MLCYPSFHVPFASLGTNKLMGVPVGLGGWRWFALVSFFPYLFLSLSSQMKDRAPQTDLRSVSFKFGNQSDETSLSSGNGNIRQRTMISNITCNEEERAVLNSVRQAADRWCQLAMRASQPNWPFDQNEFRRYFGSIRHDRAYLRQIVHDHYRLIHEEINRLDGGIVLLSCNFPSRACAHRRDAVVVQADRLSIIIVKHQLSSDPSER